MKKSEGCVQKRRYREEEQEKEEERNVRDGRSDVIDSST